MTPSSRAQSMRAVVAGAACLAILGGMLVGHAWPLWTGQSIVLPVRPVDPRDLFRGEYVRLATPVTTLIVRRPGASPLPSGEVVEQEGPWPKASVVGRIVYVQLEPRSETTHAGAAEFRAVSISLEPKPFAVNLRGRVRSAGTIHPDHLEIDYGLDAFFMQEGAARGVEQALRQGRRVQMDVAVAASGRARIRNLIIDGTPLPR